MSVRVVRAEFTKLRSVPSTAWSLATAVVLVVAFAAMYSTLRVTRPPADPAAFDATAVALAGVSLAQIAVGVLGVLLVTGEYATGLIRTSVTAVPTRLPLLWGKSVAFGLVTAAVAVPAVVGAFFVGQSVLRREHLDVAFGAPGVARAVLGGALYLVGVGLLGLALGALLRNTAGAVSALFGMLFALQMVAGMLPESISDDINKYLPAPAGLAVTYVDHDRYSLGPWAGFGVFCLYVGVLLGLAAWRLRRRDV
ncbi:ABC transporter permease [Virgisporangium aliadipatigenens]|uniref:ABC transporter permease n=1 Tax=Virgisporangium aliadipatigenens TaxID=741659 RepID=A0A8J3YS41_9ACTN|nr:ABC transporter permease [Virgisporangium aliadipatigenens]GIJ50684.1 ABC transporter permease [Virgisporangium aliadipatigenens]